MVIVKICQRNECGTAWDCADGNLQKDWAFDALKPIDAFRQWHVWRPQHSALGHAIDEPTYWVIQNQRTADGRAIKGNIEAVDVGVITK